MGRRQDGRIAEAACFDLESILFDMSLQYIAFENTTFYWHHSVEVLCQVEFPTVLALSSHSGVVGFQEALRSDYPKFSKTLATVDLSEGSDVVPQSLPIWILQDDDRAWRVSLGCNFIALSSTNGKIEEAFIRLSKILQILERTIAPDRSTWMGLRRISHLSPVANSSYNWHHLISDELLKPFDVERFNRLSEFKSVTFESVTLHGMIHLHDDNSGILTISHGLYDKEANYYILDLEYETTESFSMEASDAIVKKLQSYSDPLAKSFQWCIKPEMIKYLEPPTVK